MERPGWMETAAQLLLAVITFVLFFAFVRADAAAVAWGSKGDQVRQVQQKIKQIDPRAFLVVTDAYDTYGEGFKAFPEDDAIQAE